MQPELNLDTNLEDLNLDGLIELTRVKNHGLKFDVVEITPDMARVLLKWNTPGPGKRNRPIARHQVMKLSKDIAARRWKLTGEALVIDSNGNITNGQHRLYGCIEANTPFTTVIIRGVNPHDFMVMDQGKTRRYMDQLPILGEDTMRAEVQAFLTRVYEWERGQLGIGYTTLPTNMELEEVRQRHPNYLESIRVVGPLKSQFYVARSYLACCYYLFKLANAEKAHEFFSLLNTGAGLDVGNPILTLRNRLTRQTKKTTVPGNELMAITIKAWNAWVRGKNQTLLVWRPSNDEPFPQIFGLPQMFVKEGK